jgi:hypothetical protein
MFTHNYRNRFDMNHTTTNILMTQIRAEKTLYASKNTQAQSSRREEFRGKKVYHDILNRPSLSPTARENRSNVCKDTQRGKLMLMETSNLPQERSRSGRKQFNESYKREMTERVSIEKECKPGRKRLDHSPIHQHLRTNFTLNWN